MNILYLSAKENVHLEFDKKEKNTVQTNGRRKT